MQKVLIITYYWPPAGGAGVQRWLKFVKYMRHFNWEPVVYTAEGGEAPVVDESLQKDVPPGITVIRRPIWEPYAFYKLLSGRGKSEKINASFLSEKKKGGFAEKFSVWVRGNFFIPDARKFWIRPSIRFLSKYLEKEKIRYVISSGPPHSMHLIALGLRKKFPEIKWLADFRDPWTNIDFYDKLMLSKMADRRHRKLELEVLRSADRVVTVGKTMTEEFKTMLGVNGHNLRKFHTITNGFDTADMLEVNPEKDTKFSLAHIGTLVKDRDPEALWEVLQDLVSENEAFRAVFELKLVGKVDIHVRENIEKHGLSPYTRYIDYMPHQEVIMEQRKSRLLLLLVNNTRNARGIITGKLFEYLATGVPVLAIGPEDGDVAEILSETSAGVVVDFHDTSKLKKRIMDFFSGLVITSDPLAINKYSRHELTRALCRVLDEM